MRPCSCQLHNFGSLTLGQPFPACVLYEDLLSNLPLSISRPVGLPRILFAGIEPARLSGVACCYGFPHLLPFRCVVRILNSSPAMAATWAVLSGQALETTKL